MIKEKYEDNLLLCESAECKIYYKDLINALNTLGIQSGDTLCIHSCLFPLGKPALEKYAFLEAIIQAFEQVIGSDGTIIMPTFTYSFCKNEVYNIHSSPSTVGILTEYFRKRPGTVRTKHPIFSFALSGRRKNELLDINWDAFSDGSLYGKIRDTGGKLLFLGAPKGYTFYYLSEQKVKVKHRFFKNFSGVIQDVHQKYICTVPYYVRHLDMRSLEDENKVNAYLNETGIQRNVKLGKGKISCVVCSEMFKYCVDKLKIDEAYFLQD